LLLVGARREPGGKAQSRRVPEARGPQSQEKEENKKKQRKKYKKTTQQGGKRVRARSSLRPSYGPAAEWCMETYLPTLSCCSVFITLGENHFHNTIHLSYENIVLLNQKRQMSCKNSILHNVNHQRRERVHRRGGAS
jgi:hypothetical protein